MAYSIRILTDSVSVQKLLAMLIAIAFMSGSLTIPHAAAAANYLDTSFGNAGKVTTNVNGSQEGLSRVVVQMDGKLIAAGNDNSGTGVYIARYNNDGSLDTTFATTGWIKTTDQFLEGLAVQSDGKILVGNNTFGLGVSRYNPNGTLDTTFGAGGRASTVVGSSSGARAIGLQFDGKIIVAGYSNSATGDQDFALVRFNSNGTLDTTFGNNGKVTTNVVGFVDFVTAVAIQPDGKIVASGVGSGSTLASSNFATVRYNSNGTLNSGFGTNGIVVTDFFNNFDFPNDVAIQNDGKIVVAGEAGHHPTDASQDDFGIVRYDPDGSLDSSFGGTGKVTSDFSGGHSDQAHAVAAQADGKIVVAGQSFFSNGDFLIARYDSNGSLDSSFGDGGKVITDFGNSDAAYGMTIQPDGKIIAVGQAVISIGNTVDTDFALARYYESGQSSPPKLLIDPGSTHGVALDSVTMVRDAFTVMTPYNFSGDQHTRLALLATSADLLPGETSAVVTAQAEDAAHLIHALPVEFVGKVQNSFWFTQVVVKLTDDLAHAGDVQVSVSVRGVVSNKVPVRIN